MPKVFVAAEVNDVALKIARKAATDGISDTQALLDLYVTAVPGGIKAHTTTFVPFPRNLGTQLVNELSRVLPDIGPHDVLQSSIQGMYDALMTTLPPEEDHRSENPMREYIEGVLEEIGIYFDIKMSSFARYPRSSSEDPERVSLEDVGTIVKSELYNDQSRDEYKYLKVPAVDAEIKRIGLDARVRAYQELRDTLRYCGSEDYARQWWTAVMTMYRPVNLSIDACVDTMMHTCWQVKRGLYREGNLGNGYPTLVSLRSKTAIGKSSLVKKLTLPIESYCLLDARQTDITDSRANNSLADNILLVFDEQVKGEDSGRSQDDSAAAIKQIMSSNVIHNRVLGSSQIDRKVKRAAFLSLSNRSITEFASDATEATARRCVEIISGREPHEGFWQGEQASIWSEYLCDGDAVIKMWQSVDESAPIGYHHPDSASWQEIWESQQSLIDLKPHHEYLTDCVVPDGSASTTLEDIYQGYSAYCTSRGIQGQYIRGRTKFGNDIEEVYPGSRKPGATRPVKYKVRVLDEPRHTTSTGRQTLPNNRTVDGECAAARSVSVSFADFRSQRL